MSQYEMEKKPQSTKQTKKKSKKRSNRGDDIDYPKESYNHMELRDLRKLLIERELPNTTNKSRAIVALEAYDKGISLEIPKRYDPKRFKTTLVLETNTASTLYSDPTKPFNGVPMSVFIMHMFNYLAYEDRLSLAKTCRNFYVPLMQSICSGFQRFLQQCTERGEDKLVVKLEMQPIIDTGVGITPLAVAYAAKREILDRESKHYCNSSRLRKIIGIIHRNGSIDNDIAIRKAKSIKIAAETVPIQERISFLNREIAELGYEKTKWVWDATKESGTSCVVINGDKFFSFYLGRLHCNLLVFNTNRLDGNPNMKSAIQIFDRYIRQGIEFDWAMLTTYIDFISPSYNIRKRVHIEDRSVIDDKPVTKVPMIKIKPIIPSSSFNTAPYFI